YTVVLLGMGFWVFESTSVSKPWLLSEKKGVWAAVIGTRLHAAVAIACVVMAFYVLFIK
uniref:Uncharacterized protein n=1 Tax=Rhinopithecus bieti TaxID=61621 RepID=A0A2K6KJC4_RHIBE